MPRCSVGEDEFSDLWCISQLLNIETLSVRGMWSDDRPQGGAKGELVPEDVIEIHAELSSADLGRERRWEGQNGKDVGCGRQTFCRNACFTQRKCSI